MKVYVNIKKISSKRESVEKIPYDLKKKPLTAEELLDEFVEICLSEYKERHSSKEFLSLVTKDEIENKEKTGKISFGSDSKMKKISSVKCKEIARESFKDGLIAVFIDGKELKNEEKTGIKDLQQKININENSEITFIKLAFIAGRIW